MRGDDALAVRVYRRALVILPRRFRRQRGGAMAAMLADEWRERRGMGRGVLLVRALVDLLWTAVLERISRSENRHPEVGGMGQDSPSGRTRPAKAAWASWLDVKLGARMLVKHPGVTIVGGLAMAIGVGLGAAYLEVVNDFLHPTLPLDEGERIVGLQNWDVEESDPELRSIHDFVVWREELESVQQLGAFRSTERNLGAADGPAEPAQGAEITPSAFEMARVGALLGRTLIDADEEEGTPSVIVLGYDLWRNRFSGDPGVVGQTVHLGSSTSTVVGVMPEGFAFPLNHQFWVPLRPDGLLAYERRQGPPIQTFGRLAP